MAEVSNLYVDKALTGLVIGKANSYVADKLAPVVLHDQPSGSFPTLNDAHKVLHTDYAPLTGQVPTVESDYSWTDFSCDLVAFDGKIPMVNLGEPSLSNLETQAFAAYSAAMQRVEYDVAAALLGASGTSTSVTGSWDTATDSGDTVVEDVEVMKLGVYDAVGAMPNVMACGSDVYSALRKQMWSKLNNPTSLTKSQIADALELDDIVVVGGKYSTTTGGSLTAMWTAKTAIVFCRGDNAFVNEDSGEVQINALEPSFAKTIRYDNGNGIAGVEIVRLEDQTDGAYGNWIVRARIQYKPVITLAAASTKNSVLA